jgi:16S rRNA (uracil1498-N3)-methyltransferase
MDHDTAPPWFFVPRIDENPLRVTGDEAHHIRTTRRLRAGDRLVLFDGAGGEVQGTIEYIDRHEVGVALASVTTHPRPAGGLTLATCMPKGRRQDILIEKATELSVAAVWPMITARSVVRPDAIRVSKWQRTAIEAAKQSRQPFMPEIGQPTDFDTVLERFARFDRILLAAPDPEAVSPADLFRSGNADTRFLALIGPEGGFTAEEHHTAVSAGAVPVRLAPAILRVETAALTVAATVAAYRVG